MLYSKEKLLYNQIFHPVVQQPLFFSCPRFYGFAIFAVPGWVCDFAS